MTTNEPLFYSMAEGSHEGDDHDDEDPHLRRSRGAGHEYDPFNLEDIPDDEREDGAGLEASLGDAQDSLPLLLQSNWRQAHKQPQRQAKSPSPESSPSSSNDSLPMGLDMFEDDRPAPRPTLTQSLLPRNPDAPFVFNLPVPGRIPRRKYNDAGWANLWYASMAICAIGFILTLFLTNPTYSPSSLLYSTLTHTIPLITLFTIISAFTSYLIIALLRFAVKPVLMATSVAVPMVMIVAATWAFAASFIWTGKEGGWAETVGLRLFALVPLVLAGLSARSLYNRRLRLHETISVVSLSTRLLLEPGQLPLLALSPAILLASVLASLPFISLIFHLLLIRYSSGGDWHVKPYAGWLTFGAIFVWVWTWFIARDVLRMSVATVIGSWYFLDRRIEPIEETRAAIYRATSPSLGSNCLSAIVMTGVQVFTFAIQAAARVTVPPMLLPIITPLAAPTAFLSNAMASLSHYALVYAGITGEGFFSLSKEGQGAYIFKRAPVSSWLYLIKHLTFFDGFCHGSPCSYGCIRLHGFHAAKSCSCPYGQFHRRDDHVSGGLVLHEPC